MVVDISPLLRGEVKQMEIDYLLSPLETDGVRFDGDARVSGILTDNAGYMRLSLKAALNYHGECARCLAPVDGVFSLDFNRTVATEEMLSDPSAEEDSDEYVILNGHELDVDEALTEELFLAFPTRLLCSEDCPGLCPICGKPKRDGDCGCSQKEIDPRLAVLAKFFDKDEDEKQ